MNKYQEALDKYEKLLKDLPYAVNYMNEHKLLKELVDKQEKLENNSLVKSLNKANKKYLKVLDILKDKIFVERFNNNEFGLVIDSYCTNATTITKEEYDVLKEVLE